MSIDRRALKDPRSSLARLGPDVFWFYAAFAALLGDAFGAKNTTARLAAVAFLLVGNVVFAVVFGEVILHI